MMISYQPYTLEAVSSLNSQSSRLRREGALLKIVFKDGLVGYGDCHPWIELGDLALQDQLELLRHALYTPLTYCSLQFARLDAEARARAESLFDSSDSLISHFLITDLLSWSIVDFERLIDQGFLSVKIKMGRELERETRHLRELFAHMPLKARLDFNEKLSELEFKNFLDETKFIHSSFDFIEDPFPFHAKAWKGIQADYQVNLACDRQALSAVRHPDSAAFLIVKPAIQAKEQIECFPSEKLIVTSYLDHPLGQLAAAYRIKELNLTDRRQHGLLTHRCYQSNAFSSSLSWKGPKFLFPVGTGFGYDEELSVLEWTTLA